MGIPFERGCTRIFLFEYLTGGGLLTGAATGAADSLLSEGRAMVVALAADLARAGQQVVVMRDKRMPAFDITNCDERLVACEAGVEERFLRLAASANWTIIIAPEIGGQLARFVELANSAGARVLGSDLATIRICSDKQATTEWLRAARVPVPLGEPLEVGAPLPNNLLYPAILKPRDGAGSQGVRLIESRRAVGMHRVEVPSRLERFHPGIPASVAVLCGPNLVVPLPACRQHLADDGTFAYLGGELPLDSNLAECAARLACRAFSAFPGARGYLGVDLVLGSSPHGTDDHVIEINPRLTTSYVGLRTLCRENLAAAMCDVAEGKQPKLSWKPGKVEFWPDGRVRNLG